MPHYIYSFRNEYKFYIRNHSLYGIETVSCYLSQKDELKEQKYYESIITLCQPQ